MNKKELLETLQNASNNYYNEGNLIMSDEKFDKLKKEYEDKYGKLEDGFSPSKRLVNAEHKFENLVGTLEKANDMNDIDNWLNSFNFIDSDDEIEILVSYKYDGNSISIEYDNGKMVQALTRGKDGKGADMSELFKDREIQIDKNVGVRYEAMLTYDNFEKISEERGSSYANPRSLVAGLLHDLDSAKYLSRIDLVPLGVAIENYDINRKDELVLMDKGIPTDNISFTSKIFKGNKDKILEDINNYYEEIISKRSELDYMIDGLVIELLDEKYRTKLGYINSQPRFSIALKFPYMEKESIITDMEYDVSPTGSGRITPVVKYEPVYFNGAEQNRTSLSSYKRFQELQPIGIGTKILVEYRNDVLSYVTKLDDSDNDKIKPTKFIDKCPVCNSSIKLNKNKALAYCSNDSCESKIMGKINKYIRELDIKGIELKTIEKLYDANLINNIPDLYKVNFRDIMMLKGFGHRSAMEFKDAISGNIPTDYQVIAGMGIESIGQRLSREVVNRFDFEDLLDIDFINSDKFLNEVLNIDGFSNILANRLQKGLLEYNDVLNEINSLTNINKTKKVVIENPLRFVITGDTLHFSNRSELKDYIESNGHKMTGGISGLTDYLISNFPDSGTVKNKDAKEKGIPIISDKEVIDIIESYS